jgi:chromosome segregation ATPase
LVSCSHEVRVHTAIEQQKVQIVNLQKENKALATKLEQANALQSELDRVRAELVTQGHEVAALKEQLRMRANGSKAATSEREGYLKRISDTEAALTKTKTELELLKESFRAAKKEVARLEASAVSSQRELKLAMGKSTAAEKETIKLKNIEKERREATASLAAMEKEHKTSTTALQNTREELKEVTATLKALQKSARDVETDLSAKVAQLSEEVDSLKDMNTRLESKLDNTDSTSKDLFQALKEEKNARRDETTRLKKGLADLLHDKEDLQEKIAQQDADAKAAEAHIAKVTAKHQSMAADLERTKQRLAEVIEAESRGVQENETLQTALSGASEQLDVARAEIMQLTLQHEKLTEDRDTLKQELSHAGVEHEKLFHTHEALQAAMKTSLGTEKQLEQTVLGLTERIELLNRSHVECMEDLAREREHKQQLASELMDKSNDIARLVGEQERAQSSMELLKDKIQALQQASAEHHTAYTFLEKQHEATTQELTDTRAVLAREQQRFKDTEELLTTKVHTQASKNTELLKCVSELETDKMARERTLAELETSKATLMLEKADLKASWDLLQEKLTQLTAKHEATTKELSHTKLELQKQTDLLEATRSEQVSGRLGRGSVGVGTPPCLVVVHWCPAAHARFHGLCYD